jgi:hypothetical protein
MTNCDERGRHLIFAMTQQLLTENNTIFDYSTSVNQVQEEKVIEPFWLTVLSSIGNSIART